MWHGHQNKEVKHEQGMSMAEITANVHIFNH